MLYCTVILSGAQRSRRISYQLRWKRCFGYAQHDKTPDMRNISYKTSNFIWNELLVGHLPKVDVERLPEELQSEPVAPDGTGAFPKDKVDERQRLLFSVIKQIWCDSISSST